MNTNRNTLMRHYMYILISVMMVGLFLGSCEQYLEPKEDNLETQEIAFSSPARAEGLLIKAYISLPNQPVFFNEAVVTDNAVTNVDGSQYRQMATGAWKATFNPLSQWGGAYNNIFYVNYFLDHINEIEWPDKTSAEEASFKEQRMRGEAFGLRALYEFKLLKAHAGETEGGDLLGFPIVTEVVEPGEIGDRPRNTFSDCIAQILADCDSAIAYLPARYEDFDNEAKQAAMGEGWKNRMNGDAARALKSMVTLYAASPAYNESQANWERAAKVAGTFIASKGGPDISSDGAAFYRNPDSDDIIWRTTAHPGATSLDWEQMNFPPSLEGNGEVNPTQDLVSSFPMKSGYPIDHSNSQYDSDNPYADRDDRLSEYVLYNGAPFKDTAIYTHTQAPTDGINQGEFSTRSGFYLKKFMMPGVSLQAPQAQKIHFRTFFRMTEVYLNYAEAAFEAWGWDADPQGYGFTAKDIITSIREEHGGITQPDQYVETISGEENIRQLIHNERRLELCFEGHRFWDIRRWADTETMKDAVEGVFATAVTDSTFTYETRQIESRAYEDYMIYGPVPYNDVLNFDLEQNKGW